MRSCISYFSGRWDETPDRSNRSEGKLSLESLLGNTWLRELTLSASSLDQETHWKWGWRHPPDSIPGHPLPVARTLLLQALHLPKLVPPAGDQVLQTLTRVHGGTLHCSLIQAIILRKLSCGCMCISILSENGQVMLSHSSSDPEVPRNCGKWRHPSP